jgi:hypothetical protein
VSNSARKEIVVIAGPVGSPVTKTLNTQSGKERVYRLYCCMHSRRRRLDQSRGDWTVGCKTVLDQHPGCMFRLHTRTFPYSDLILAHGDTRSYAKLPDSIEDATPSLPQRSTSRPLLRRARPCARSCILIRTYRNNTIRTPVRHPQY